MKTKHIQYTFLVTILLGMFYYIVNYTNKYDPFLLFQPSYKYKSEFAILNKSFKRDLKRSANLYQSFEKYYIGAESIPFYIVVPEIDLDLFKNEFKLLKNESKIYNYPILITEKEIIDICKEPEIVLTSGYWAMQTIRLCFGMTNLARNYFSIDSDAYFTRTFDKHSDLFKNDILKVMSGKMSKEDLEKSKKNKLGLLKFSGLTHTVYDHLTKIKDFWGNKVSTYYGFIFGGVLISSDVIHKMYDLMQKKGGYNFATITAISPFETQWYGEYLLQHEKFFSSKILVFSLISSPDECHIENSKHDYGKVFQSVIYDYKTHKASIDNDKIIYKRPAHCN